VKKTGFLILLLISSCNFKEPNEIRFTHDVEPTVKDFWMKRDIKFEGFTITPILSSHTEGDSIMSIQYIQCILRNAKGLPSNKTELEKLGFDFSRTIFPYIQNREKFSDITFIFIDSDQNGLTSTVKQTVFKYTYSRLEADRETRTAE
jgi:hypothetical protein